MQVQSKLYLISNNAHILKTIANSNRYYILVSSLHVYVICHIYLNAKETQPFSIHFFFHIDHMKLIS